MKPPSQAVPPSGALPREVGGLRLLRELGRGGMGIVYEAEEIETGRRVAVKVLLSDLGVSGEAFERFQREARLAASISHGHCVFVYGAQKIDGSPAIVMELVGGETLEDKIRRGEPIPVRTAARWMIDVLDGLEAAHGSGVLHRDVKPSNCFVTPEGRVKVGDFGLSRSIERDVHLTQTGQFLGSPLYASPEQIRGRSYDERSDLYSCAATLYAMLAGRAPYGGSNVGEVLARILSEPPPPLRSIRPDVPSELEHVVLRAMERDPESRYADLAEFREALLPFATGKVAVASPWKRLGAFLVDLGVVVLLSWAAMVVTNLLGWEAFSLLEDVQSQPLGAHIALILLPIIYFSVLEGWLGSGLGKWLFGIRVVSSTSRRPNMPRATLRTFVFYGPAILHGMAMRIWSEELADVGGLQLLSVAYFVLMFVSARRSNGWKGLHELASRTAAVPADTALRRVRVSAAPPERVATAESSLPSEFGGYRVEGLIGRTPSGRVLKARDTALERSVWIHLPDGDVPIANETRRTLARTARLRWLGMVRADGRPADVFESPGGTSLPELSRTRGRVPWTTARRLLAALVEELQAMKDPTVLVAPEQIWIDRNWGLRLLDEPVGEGPFAQRNSVRLVHEAAHALFIGNTADAPVLPPELSYGAEAAVNRLVGRAQPFTTLDEIEAALRSLEGANEELQRRTRGSQIAVNVVLPTLVVVMSVLVGHFLRTFLDVSRHVQTLADDLESNTIIPPGDAKEAPIFTLDDDARRARDILIVDELSNALGAALIETFTDSRKQVIEDVRARQPKPSDADVEWARNILLAEHGRSAKTFKSRVETGLEHVGSSVTLFVTVLWGIVSVPSSFVFAGGFMFWLFGIRVRNKRGERASRFLCGARTFLVWSPLLLSSVGLFVLASTGHGVWALVLGSLVSVGFLVAIVDAVQNPQQSWIDRLLGTRLVPK